MRKRFWIAPILLLYSFQLFAASPNEDWQKGNNFYKQKQYDSAAYYYEQLAAQKPKDAVLYYNLGNTYYKLNDIGHAVLNYEKALHLDPGYKEAEDNLILTQSRIANRIQGGEDIFFVRWWRSVTQVSNASMWSVVSLLLFISLLGILYAKRIGKFDFSYQRQVIIILGILLLLGLILSYSSALRHESHAAVVMQQDAPLMTSRKNNKPQTLVPEGTTVKTEEEQDGWIEVTLPDGRKGWMQVGLLGKI